MKEIINLRNYRPVNSSSFSGRPQGESVRKALDLDRLDSNQDDIEIMVPADTTSFNPSFFLGLLYESIVRLGMEKFLSKYKISFETSSPSLKNALSKNVQDALRNASNSLNKKTGLNII